MTHNDAALDAILAAMSRKSGHSSSYKDEVKSKNSVASRKRSFHKIEEACDGKELSASGIWNSKVRPIIALDDVKTQVGHLSVKGRIEIESAALEVERHRLVRRFCTMIEEAAAEIGITSVPNSVYEVWKFTSSLFNPKINTQQCISNDRELEDEFIKCGVDQPRAAAKCQELYRMFEEAVQDLHQKHQSLSRGRRRNKIKSCIEADQVSLSFGGVTVKCSAAHYSKLKHLHSIQVQCDRDGKSPLMNPNEAIFCVLMRYMALDGGGLHASLNEECFDVMLQYFDCQMECFASPLNSRYQQYCSAYPDTDFRFGSIGSFFHFYPQSGCYESNPPFLPRLIERMATHMTALLKSAEEALMFIIVVPAWKHTKAWQLLHESPYKNSYVFLRQKNHGFCEGKQQTRKTRWRIASSDSSIFFWQNKKAQEKWPVHKEGIQKLEQAFRSKQIRL
uniref:Uncharacterized protein AlNc14C72G4915 n=1 Tax=Albugo laibachii Nc14 TaxID=890382 RepID=F0WE56_9STRA|nr:conserved hypothetical protein [Albugo laibachii Nc14]|eukprot:CCA19485.1 conserved hypothetical protein [Albugo laibachii Nc14]